MSTNNRKWTGLSPAARAGIVAVGAVEVALAEMAWTDLARRDASQVNGSKKAWAFAIAVNFVGPIAYFVRGRRRQLRAQADSTSSTNRIGGLRLS